jgi:cytidylate kinase
VPASVICIAHADGAHGREVGRLVAEALGYRYADEAIVVAAARSQGIFPEAVALAERPGVGRSIEVDFGRHEKTETVRELIRETVVATADEGNVVIVAHAASYALESRDGVLRVLVTGSPAARAAAIAAEDGLDDRAASRRVSDSDKARAEYLRRFYDVRNEQPSDYDVVLLTDRVTPEAAAAAIVALAGG